VKDDTQEHSWLQHSVAHWEHMRIQCPWLPERSDGWHRHQNGGGWVQDTARVEPSAYVGAEALVFDFARVLENARVSDWARVYGQACLRDAAHVCGHAQIHDCALVCHAARVYGRAEISGRAVIAGTACVCSSVIISGAVHLVSGTWRTQPLYITGAFPFSMYAAGPEIMGLGWLRYSLDGWEELGADVAAQYGFNPEELLNTWLPVFRAWFRKHPVRVEEEQ